VRIACAPTRGDAHGVHDGGLASWVCTQSDQVANPNLLWCPGHMSSGDEFSGWSLGPLLYIRAECVPWPGLSIEYKQHFSKY
jgi:hypothetical protein